MTTGLSAASPPTTGLVLFAHGARDARWAEPLHRLHARVAALVPGTPVALAFLDFMTPDLAGATEALVALGCRAVRIVPVFFGQGGHIRDDLPGLLADLAGRHPDVDIRCALAIGEDDAVLDALAAYCLRQLAG
jgi:sirohydrochlorin cobaltochelatase